MPLGKYIRIEAKVNKDGLYELFDWNENDSLVVGGFKIDILGELND